MKREWEEGKSVSHVYKRDRGGGRVSRPVNGRNGGGKRGDIFCYTLSPSWVAFMRSNTFMEESQGGEGRRGRARGQRTGRNGAGNGTAEMDRDIERREVPRWTERRTRGRNKPRRVGITKQRKREPRGDKFYICKGTGERTSTINVNNRLGKGSTSAKTYKWEKTETDINRSGK